MLVRLPPPLISSPVRQNKIDVLKQASNMVPTEREHCGMRLAATTRERDLSKGGQQNCHR